MSFSQISDERFQILIDEIYHCAGWARNDEQFSNLFSLLNAVLLQDRKCLSASFLPSREHVLTTRIGDLKRDDTVFDLCLEISRYKCLVFESLDRKTVLQLLRQVVKSPPRKKVTQQMQRWHRSKAALILQRRDNGDL